jgi:hypothetical protein
MRQSGLGLRHGVRGHAVQLQQEGSAGHRGFGGQSQQQAAAFSGVGVNDVVGEPRRTSRMVNSNDMFRSPLICLRSLR